MPALALSLGLPFRSTGGGAAAGPPATPTGFTATAQESAILLGWDAQSEADTFEIYFSAENVFGTAVQLTSEATGTSEPHNADDGIQFGEKYYYWLRAINGAGVSGWTDGSASSVTARSFVTVNNNSRNVTTPTGTWTFGTILFAQNATPTGITINKSSVIREYDGVGWLNLDTFEYDDAVSLDGAFTVTKTGAAYTFWDTEP